MSQKQTLIIAVAVNSVLLLVLFLTALPQEEKIAVLPVKREENPFASKAMAIGAASPEDEVDLLLSEWNIKQAESRPIVAAEVKKEMLPITVAPLSLDSQDHIEVVVKKGDSLEKLARLYHSSVQEIAKLNHLTPTATLRVGQSLKVAVSTKEKKSSDPIMESADYYVVKSGDSPWMIATKNNVKLEELLKLNELDDEKARKLKPGDRLKIK